MLKQFKVVNFKSLLDVTFEPGGLNLLVGSNNAGKTNLCHAMRFLSLTGRMSLQDAARECTGEPWSLANVYLDKPTIDLVARCVLPWQGVKLDFEYELSLSAPRAGQEGRGVSQLEVYSEALRLTGGGFDQTLLLENKAGNVRILHERRFLGEVYPATDDESEPEDSAQHSSSSSANLKEPYITTSAPTHHTMLFRLYDLQTNRRANLFKSYLGRWQYYAFDPLRLRSHTAQPLETEIAADGSNLASVLNSIKSSDGRLFRKIVEATRAVEPKLEEINFKSPDPEHVYMFFEDESGKRFSATNISDGTLRYLALSSVIILNRRPVDEGSGVPIVMIEEPENGIFVGSLKPLFERIEPSGIQGQYVFTSHAPYFIDLFDGCLDGIWVVRNQQTHSSIERPPRERIQLQLGKYSLGEQHFRGLLQ